MQPVIKYEFILKILFCVFEYKIGHELDNFTQQIVQNVFSLEIWRRYTVL